MPQAWYGCRDGAITVIVCAAWRLGTARSSLWNLEFRSRQYSDHRLRDFV